jgi:hypothetical protein
MTTEPETRERSVRNRIRTTFLARSLNNAFFRDATRQLPDPPCLALYSDRGTAH